MVNAAARGAAAEQPWSWAYLLDSFLGGKAARSPGDSKVDAFAPPLSDADGAAAVAALPVFPPCCGAGGAAAAAWLLNEHGPVPEHTRAPLNGAALRQVLCKAWNERISSERKAGRARGEDERARFLSGRVDADLAAAGEEELDALAESSLAALLREDDEDTGKANATSEVCGDGASTGSVQSTATSDGAGRPQPNGSRQQSPLLSGLTPADFAILSTTYGVDFVLHGVPGLTDELCDRCGTSGHVHTGEKNCPGSEQYYLHVHWRPAKATTPASPAAASSAAVSRGFWEPLGAGPVAASTHATPSTPSSAGDPERNLSGIVVYSAQPSSGPPAAWSVSATGDETLVVDEVDPPFRWPWISTCASSPCPCASVAWPWQPASDTADDARDPRLIRGPSGDESSHMQANPASRAREVRGLGLNRGGVRLNLVWEAEGETGQACESPSHELRDALVAGVSAAAGITASRVRVLDVGPPLHFGASAGSASSAKQPDEDRGAGVLAFLAESDDHLSADEAPRAKAAEGRGLVRALMLIKEQEGDGVAPGASLSAAEEPCALQALNVLAKVLNDPRSAIQESLRARTGASEIRLAYLGGGDGLGTGRPRPAGARGGRARQPMWNSRTGS
eukprot:TRINITY_DN17815_c0_g1_i2.p1 TRINITY_DN17815_c0_g1~~TRINITY_DN17815_c0_g1_i2.p1  ORF type:complete len:647 (+),score=118.73 TRINITY_DN17815_c0_g1_i2:74-1942(+)